jgi:hypothetical protein
LWLAPLTASPPADFGHAVTDHFRLSSVSVPIPTCARVSMQRIISRTSTPIFWIPAGAAARRPISIFLRARRRARRTHYFNWDNFKNLNNDNPEVERTVIEGFAHWLSAFDIDGFRVTWPGDRANARPSSGRVRGASSSALGNPSEMTVAELASEVLSLTLGRR